MEQKKAQIQIEDKRGKVKASHLVPISESGLACRYGICSLLHVGF
jgi:hypothetical protein